MFCTWLPNSPEDFDPQGTGRFSGPQRSLWPQLGCQFPGISRSSLGESLVKIRGGWPMMAWCSTQDATCRAPCRYQQTSWSVCTSASSHLKTGNPTIPMDSLNMSQPVVTPFLAFAQASFFFPRILQTMPKFRSSTIGFCFQESVADVILGMFFLVFDSQRLNIDIQPRLRKTDPDHLLRRLNLWFLASRTDPSRMQRAGSQQALVFIEITKRAMVMECSFTA